MNLKFVLEGVSFDSRAKVYNKNFRQRFVRKIIEIELPPDQGGEDMAKTKLVCGEDIDQGNAVCVYDNKLYKADAYNPDRIKYIGIALESGTVGSEIEVLISGEFTVPYSFSNSGFLYVSSAGSYSLFPPYSTNGEECYSIKVGVASGNKIIVQYMQTIGIE